ncbi:MAG TPA: dihydrolipoamide acetyltransferase family protein [Anaerolineaceae bacterium]|nr:dihydrolipoamide acetyltransferase family protein [Anaerolineaceae bacterium]
MATKLIAPRPGEGVEELTVVAWLKQVGDQVEEFESVVELETDKVVTEFPSPISGTLLRIDVAAGDSVKVGEVMGLIGKPGESLDEAAQEPAQVPQPQEAPAEEIKQEKPVVTEKTAAKSSFLSPLVRKMLDEHQLDPDQIQGTGSGGRITKQDVEAFLASPKKEAQRAPEPKPDLKEKPAQPAKSAPVPSDLPGTLIPHTSTRKQIAARMVDSVLTSPHVLTVMEVDMTRVLAHRKANKAKFAADGVNLTLTAYFVAAMAKALSEHKIVNATWTDEGIFAFSDVNIGMAVALGEGGLIVPVIKQVQNLSLKGIASQVNDLAERARSKKLSPDDVRGGTFTLTNHGTAGSLFAMPIINQPQLGILGTGAMQKRAVVITDENGNDSIAIRPMAYLSLVFDHRAIDGESGDNFLADVKRTLENWN